jgi:hypothetical protein
MKVKEERDWFREEALRLNKKVKDLEEIVNKLKSNSNDKLTLYK